MTAIKDRIFGFDIIRCIAVLFVLLSHTCFMLPISEFHKDILMICFGFSGVEFFFVLSGYLVGKILLELLAKEKLSFKTIRYFWIRRWFRTLPAYFLTLFIYVVLYWVFQKEFIFNNPYYLTFFVFLQNFYTHPPEFFRLSWSLSVEEWFYFILPLWMFFFFSFIKKFSVLQVIVTGIIIFASIRLFAVIFFDPHWNLGTRTMVPLRLDTLMIGVLMAYFHLYHKGKWIRYTRACLIAGIILFAGMIVWLYFDMILNRFNEGFLSKTIFFSLFSTSIALFMPYLSSVKKASNKYIGYSITHISIVSYSLYLIHNLAIHYFLTAYYIARMPDYIVLKFIGSWIASIIVASIMYRWYEKPMTNLRERFKLR